jgi:hypothetical protein
VALFWVCGMVVLKTGYGNQMEGSLCQRTLRYYVTYHSIETLIGLLRYLFFFFLPFFFVAFFLAFFFFAIILSPPFG